MGATVNFQRPDGRKISGYLAEPAAKLDAAAIVVIQKWWGLNAQICGFADQLAPTGFQALVPDLYRGQSTVEAEEAHWATQDEFCLGPTRIGPDTALFWAPPGLESPLGSLQRLYCNGW